MSHFFKIRYLIFTTASQLLPVHYDKNVKKHLI